MSLPAPTTMPCADAALDHAGAERAGVVVAEALVHHHRAFGEMGAQPHAAGIGDAHAVGTT